MKTNTPSSSTPMLFAGIDYHKRYSVVHVLDASGATVKKGRIEPNGLGGFAGFFAGFPKGSVRAVFESSLNCAPLGALCGQASPIACAPRRGSGATSTISSTRSRRLPT